jgi:hypothetical protein
MSADRYDFDVEIEGFDRLIDWIRLAGEELNSHSSSERAYGRELLNRAKGLIDDILNPAPAESTTAGFYL